MKGKRETFVAAVRQFFSNKYCEGPLDEDAQDDLDDLAGEIVLFCFSLGYAVLGAFLLLDGATRVAGLLDLCVAAILFSIVFLVQTPD